MHIIYKHIFNEYSDSSVREEEKRWKKKWRGGKGEDCPSCVVGGAGGVGFDSERLVRI